MAFKDKFETTYKNMLFTRQDENECLYYFSSNDFDGLNKKEIIIQSSKGHKIARVTNIPMDLREQMTELDEDGNPRLKPSWYGKVASVDGQCISAREKRLKHAVLVEWRPDRSEDTCIIDRDFLESMVL